MTRGTGGDGRRVFSRVGVIAIALVAAGLALGFTVHIGFLALAALGLFGPGLLREAGVLGDRDEFEREAARYAGYRAYLAAGAFLVVMIMTKGWGSLNLDNDSVPASIVLALMLVVYLMSYLFNYWGTTRASFRVLLTFGAFWGAFVVLSHGTEPVALLMESLVVLPFFVLAFTARRWPRWTGVALVALAAYTLFFFNLQRAFAGNAGSMMVFILMFVPIVGTGLALLSSGRREEEDAAS
ncbi:MAG: hypothetical protein OEQ13_07740 [Acidobacteriota bacterium]|nr:hypothetical protein [Acidobacteriota bacterium]